MLNPALAAAILPQRYVQDLESMGQVPSTMLMYQSWSDHYERHLKREVHKDSTSNHRQRPANMQPP